MIDFPMARVAPEKAAFRPALPLGFLPGVNGTHMGKMTYGEQLKHPEWQKKRLRMLESANWECSNCGDKSTTLHVHHRQYFKDRLAWEYDDDELVVLCEPCHSNEHAEMDGLKQMLARLNPQTVFALVAGFNKPSDWIDPGIIESGRQADALAFAAGFVAYIVHGLDIDKMRQVGEFAAGLHTARAESRMWFFHSRGNTFGEDL